MKKNELILIRHTYTDNSTIGQLSINGEHFCDTLEDKVRDVKIYGETAIPEGTYKVIINMSNRFKVLMPLLIGVPGFEGIRIHPGNTKADTHGCILVGKYNPKVPDFVSNSRTFYKGLMNKIQPMLNKGEEVYIKILGTNEI